MKIKSKVGDFEVVFVDDFNFVNNFLKLENSVVIVGSNVYRLYKKKLFGKFPKDKLMVFTLGEKNKTINTVLKIYDNLLGKTAKKNLTIISFGGGVNQDVVGFAASTLYRGVNWIYVPTTLLAMADSAIGLKTSLNLNSYKNVIGTFYLPSRIIVNVNFLKTLPKLNYYSGIGEIIKFYLMQNNAISRLRETIEKINKLRQGKDSRMILDVIKESIKIKLGFMRGDELDKGRRNLLNYGHEFGHALESSSWFAIPHGIAVLIGIIFANYVSLMRGWMDKETFDYLNKELIFPNIPQDVVRLKDIYFDKRILLGNIKKDKKRVSQDLVLVLPSKNFLLKKIEDLSVEEFEGALKELRTILKI